jgi:hypothetical protein
MVYDGLRCSSLVGKPLWVDLCVHRSLEGEGLKILIFSCSSLSSKEREAGRERFIELTSC